MQGRRAAFAAAAIGLVLVASQARARPFTVEDLIQQESLGAAAFDPTGRWLVFEQRDRYSTAPRYDLYIQTSQTLGRLRVVDLKGSGQAHALLRPDLRGLVMGPFSPNGRRLAVFRMRDHRWTLGIVTLRSGAVRWFNITPKEVGHGRTLQWISDRTFLVVDRPDRLPPLLGRIGWILGAREPAAWRRAARGASAHSVLGSGAYANFRDRGPLARLLQVDAVTGARRLLRRGEVFDLELSPDHRQVALFESGPDVQPHDDAPVRGPAGLETEASRLAIVNLANGRRVLVCPDCDLSPQLLAWSSSGRSLLAFARGADGLWSDGQLLRIEALSGHAQVVGQGVRPKLDLNPVVVRAGWMGDEPVLFAEADRPGPARADWYRLSATGPINLSAALAAPTRVVRAADAGSLTLFAQDGLWRVDGTGRAQKVADAPAAPALPDSRAADGARLANSFPEASVVSLGAGRDRMLAPVSPQGLGQGLPLPQGQAPPTAVSIPASAVLLRDRDPQGVERLTLLRGHRPPQTLVTLNHGFAATDPPQPVAVHHRGAHGESLISWLFRPTSPTADGRPPPLLVQPYLGSSYPIPPRDLYMEAGFFQNLRVLTGHGYAVLVPSLPNPPEGMTEPADHVADRILKVVDAARAEPGLAGAFDPERLALIGWSFGGYTVMATITQTDRFRAAVEMDGISDMVAYWAHLSALHVASPEDGYGGIWTTGGVEATQPSLLVPPWGNLDRYQRNSPLLAANRIHTPLMMIHGALDTIPSAGSEAMYSALFRQGKDAVLVTYWGAAHTVTSPGDLRDVYARTFAFLDDHLAATPRVAVTASIESLGATLPVAHPGFDRGSVENVHRKAAVAPDQGVRRQGAVQKVAVQESCRAEPAVEQIGPQDRKAVGDQVGIEGALVSLRPPVAHHLRQAPREGLTRERPVEAAAGQVRNRDSQAQLKHGLRRQGHEHVGRLKTTAGAAVEVGHSHALDVQLLASRQTMRPRRH
jgi:dipeptidyl aminopeptidase/acylaminoacyl peptidase